MRQHARVLLVILAAGAPAAARGQDVVPGGWDSRVGYQPFSATGEGAAGGFLAGGAGWAGAPVPSSFFQGGAPRAATAQGRSGTVNALGPFSAAVRRSARKRPPR